MQTHFYVYTFRDANGIESKERAASPLLIEAYRKNLSDHLESLGYELVSLVYRPLMS